MDITLKVASTLRQRYVECKATLKVFRRTIPKIALYGYGMSTTSKVMYSVRGFLGVPNDTGSVIVPTGLILFLPKP
jgi:ribosomal protein L10